MGAMFADEDEKWRDIFVSLEFADLEAAIEVERVRRLTFCMEILGRGKKKEGCFGGGFVLCV